MNPLLVDEHSLLNIVYCINILIQAAQKCQKSGAFFLIDDIASELDETNLKTVLEDFLLNVYHPWQLFELFH